MFCVGGVHDTVAMPVPISVTVIANAASDAVAVPSDTVIVMPLYVPTSELSGVPVTAPVDLFSEAQLGRFAAVKVSASPFESLAVGLKLYA